MRLPVVEWVVRYRRVFGGRHGRYTVPNVYATPTRALAWRRFVMVRDEPWQEAGQVTFGVRVRYGVRRSRTMTLWRSATRRASINREAL